MKREIVYHHEPLFTTPDFPLGDSFSQHSNSSLSLPSDSEDSEGFAMKPYVYVSKKLNKESPHKRSNAFFIQPLQDSRDSKNSAEVTKVTDSSRGGGQLKPDGKVAAYVSGRNNSIQLNERSGIMRKFGQSNKKCVILSKTFTPFISTRSYQSHRDLLQCAPESGMLRKYWKRKAEIEEKYRNMMIAMDKEASLEISIKLTQSTKGGPETATMIIEDLNKIKEYYEDIKTLLHKQQIIEHEDLLKESQNKLDSSNNSNININSSNYASNKIF